MHQKNKKIAKIWNGNVFWCQWISTSIKMMFFNVFWCQWISIKILVFFDALWCIMMHLWCIYDAFWHQNFCLQICIRLVHFSIRMVHFWCHLDANLHQKSIRLMQLGIILMNHQTLSRFEAYKLLWSIIIIWTSNVGIVTSLVLMFIRVVTIHNFE